MKKYALMIVASGLFCMLQVQSVEKPLRTFKHEITREVSLRAVISYPAINEISHFAKSEAIVKRIPLHEAASIVINTLHWMI